jgi:hypothetical protein
MEELRAEILEAERARSDLLKWKLVLVAALGAIGIGIKTDGGRYPLVLTGIPFVCAYVDLICRHLTLRVHVIASFLRNPTPTRGGSPELVWKERLFRSYENYAQGKEDSFSLENWALFWSSTIISVAVVAYGIGFAVVHDRRQGVVIAVSGAVGVLATCLIEYFYEKRKQPLVPSARKGPLLRGWSLLRRLCAHAAAMISRLSRSLSS